VDMIGDRDLTIRRDLNSTPWLSDLVWGAARRLELDAYFVGDTTRVEDDHLPFVAAGVPSVDIIDLDYEAWHTAKDTLDAVSARSWQVVGDVVLAALPQIETRLTKGVTLTGRRIHAKRPYMMKAVHHKLKKSPRPRRALNSEAAIVAH